MMRLAVYQLKFNCFNCVIHLVSDMQHTDKASNNARLFEQKYS